MKKRTGLAHFLQKSRVIILKVSYVGKDKNQALCLFITLSLSLACGPLLLLHGPTIIGYLCLDYLYHYKQLSPYNKKLLGVPVGKICWDKMQTFLEEKHFF